MSTYPMHQDPKLIEVLEKDLIDKAFVALTDADIGADLYGVFSLDDLDRRTEAELNGDVALGVAYSNTTNTSVRENASDKQVDMLAYQFLIVVACPTSDDGAGRVPGTRVLTALRQKIKTAIVGDTEVPQGFPGQVVGLRKALGSTQRRWQFVQEVAQVEESTPTMLYYTQVWRLLLPAN